MRNSGENGSEMTVKHLWKEGAVPVSGVSDPMSEIGESDTWMDQVKTLIRQNQAGSGFGSFDSFDYSGSGICATCGAL